MWYPVRRELTVSTVKLNKDLKLGDTGSVTTGATVINNDGVTITPTTGNPVKLTGTGLDNGGNTITNVGAGTANTDAVITACT